MVELAKAPNGLQWVDVEVGTGPKAWKGAMIQCEYVGKLDPSGKVFDKSKPGRPLGFTVGVGEGGFIECTLPPMH